MSLEEKSYKIHEKSFAKTEIEKDLNVYRNWFDVFTTDLWRHKRMLSVLDPFLKVHTQARWLTLGDGRFGTSATYINRNGGKAIATDIDLTLLKIAQENKMLPEIAYANAEKLPFSNEEFDYTYCKQAYHHFPRPILAVYEALRVSKQAIIFTEPHEYYPAPVARRFLQKIKHAIKKIIGSPVPHHDTGNYETIGNYIYTISVRDFEKIAQGLGLPCMAYKQFHDIHLKGVETEIFSENAKLYKKIKSAIQLNTIKSKLRITRPNTIQAIIFKLKPDTMIINALKKDGYTFVLFPENPYT